MQSEQLSDDLKLHPIGLGATLFLLSAASVLFTLGIFRLLTFFIMPSLFFDLLFIGFPLGALLGVRFFSVTASSFRKTLWILQVAMALSVLASLTCKHFDYLRAHLFDVELYRLILQMGTFTALFIPFFCAYGLSEYVGYQIGRKNFAGRMPVVYAVYLFGAAFAYLFMEFTLSRLGITGILCLAFLLVAIASILVTKSLAVRVILGAELLLLSSALFMPQIAEEDFLRLYKYRGTLGGSTHAFHQERDYNTVFRRWGKYSLVEVMRSEDGKQHAGFYNDLFQWDFTKPNGFARMGLGMIPLNTMPSGASVAIVGAGGGRQVKWAMQPSIGLKRIVALELEPIVIDAVRGPLAKHFEGVYEDPKVDVICREARGYMQETDEFFDLIYLPSVGSYPQMMLEPGNMIRTIEAYQTMAARLTRRGVLAIWYPRGLDPKGILTTQYIRTLESESIGLRVRAFVDDREALILASRSELNLPSRDYVFSVAPKNNPKVFEVPPDPFFKPITDNQPFLAGNVSHILSLEQVYKLFGFVGGLILLAGIILWFSLRKVGDPSIANRSYWQVGALSFLIGTNFLLIERSVILALFTRIYIFHNALVLGAIGFLIITGLGSIFITQRSRLFWQIAACVFVLILAAVQPHLSATSTLLLLAPVAFVTGSFFPAVFEAAAKNPLTVFAMDAIGAATGSCVAFFLPIAYGFHIVFPVAAVVFVGTAIATYLFFRPIAKE